MKQEKTKRQALLMFQKEHPEVQIVSVKYLYDKRMQTKTINTKLIKKLRKEGLSLREIALEVDLSHERVRYYLTK